MSASWSSRRCSSWRRRPGVDDVVLIAALALHRRMTEAELRHALGDRVYDAFAPHGLLLQHDAEDPDSLIFLGQTPEGEDVELNRRAAKSDLLVYVNINLVAMDGGHKSVATGLASYRSLRHHHNVRTMQRCRVFMDQHRSELHSSNWRMGRLIEASGVQVFQIETTLNTDTFPSRSRFLQKREWEWTLRDRAAFLARRQALEAHTGRRRPLDLPLDQVAPRLTSVQAGEVEAVHEATTENVYRQQLVDVEGQTDVLTIGLPYICPYNVNSIMNPVLVVCLGLGYFFNLYRGKPLVREGRRGHPEPPDAVGLPPGPSPELHRLLRRGAGGDDRPRRDREAYEESFATDPWYGTCTAPATPITGSTPSTCGTGRARSRPPRRRDHRRR